MKKYDTKNNKPNKNRVTEESDEEKYNLQQTQGDRNGALFCTRRKEQRTTTRRDSGGNRLHPIKIKLCKN